MTATESELFTSTMILAEYDNRVVKYYDSIMRAGQYNGVAIEIVVLVAEEEGFLLKYTD